MSPADLVAGKRANEPAFFVANNTAENARPCLRSPLSSQQSPHFSRQRDRAATLIRHASLGSAQPIRTLTSAVSESALWRGLVPAIGSTSLSSAAVFPAGMAAVALPTIANAADPENGATSTTGSLSEGDLCQDRYSHAITLHHMMKR